MKTYEALLETIEPEVSFGYETIHVLKSPELKSHQIGYSIGPTGKSLTGHRAGDWLEQWVAIGYEDLCGDPIFIDTLAPGFPVFTAIHGEGRWEPKQIADSLEQFGRVLSIIANLAKGRENPVALEENPLSQSEKENAITVIQRDNPRSSIEFWAILLTN